METGRKGVSAGPDKLDVQKITDDIRTVRCNLGQEAHYAYTSWVITSEGVVVIDTGTPSVSPLVNQEIARETSLPVKYVIYTHGHVDHTRGAFAFLGHRPNIIAHENVIQRFRRYELTGDYIRHISSIQFHRTLVPGPIQVPSFVYPTETYREEYRFQMGGKTF